MGNSQLLSVLVICQGHLSGKRGIEYLASIDWGNYLIVQTGASQLHRVLAVTPETLVQLMEK